jgi:WASH complex subunit strumpellin
VTSEPLEHLPLLAFFFVLAQSHKLVYNQRTSTLENKEKGLSLDGAPLVVGVITLLKQFHSQHTHTFLAYCGQYVRSHISSSPAGTGAGGKVAVPPEVVSVLLFLEEFCKFSHMSRAAVEAVVPSYVFDRFAHGASVEK